MKTLAGLIEELVTHIGPPSDSALWLANGGELAWCLDYETVLTTGPIVRLIWIKGPMIEWQLAIFINKPETVGVSPLIRSWAIYSADEDCQAASANWHGLLELVALACEAYDREQRLAIALA